MENAKLLSTGLGGQLTGLAGREMVFYSGQLAVFLHKGGFDKKMIGIPGKFNDFVPVGITIDHVGNVANFLTRCNMSNLPGEVSQSKLFFILLPRCVHLKFYGRIDAVL